jgi:hypothetical protein
MAKFSAHQLQLMNEATGCSSPRRLAVVQAYLEEL